MNIVIIGPVYPYKGGIAHYTSLLYQALSKEHEVTLISYKMQYPRILFNREQKDYSNDTFKIKNAQFLVNTANPINVWGVGRKIRKINPDMVLIQWWHPYFAPCYKILEMAIGRSINIIFTCHNVFPHERFWADKFLTKIVLRRGDGFIVHSKKDQYDLMELKNDANYRFNPHPTYNAFKIRNISRDEAIEEINQKDKSDLSEKDQLLLFFGFVREYKGLKWLLYAMPQIKKKLSKCKLMVIGSFENKEEYVKLIRSLNIESSVILKDDYTPDNEVEKYFAAADLVAVPYIDATQSGIVQIAYGFEKPCLVTNVGGLPDVVENEVTGYVVEPCNSEVIANAIIDYFTKDRFMQMNKNIKLKSEEFSWEHMVKTIESLMENK